jgi:hypothetical protein
MARTLVRERGAVHGASARRVQASKSRGRGIGGSHVGASAARAHDSTVRLVRVGGRLLLDHLLPQVWRDLLEVVLLLLGAVLEGLDLLRRRVGLLVEEGALVEVVEDAAVGA